MRLHAPAISAVLMLAMGAGVSNTNTESIRAASGPQGAHAPAAASPIDPARSTSPTGLSGAFADVGPVVLGPTRSFEDPAEVEAWIDDRVASLSPDQVDDPYAVIDQCITEEMTEIGAPGASLAIAVDGVITYTKGYGVRHPVDGGTIDAATMFGIGSTTKMMTAAAVMKLAEDGGIDLHAPVTDVDLTLSLAPPWQLMDITPHHLLSQTSGLADTYALPRSSNDLFMLTLEEWIDFGLGSTAANAPPDSFWNYANPNFSLAGYLVEAVSQVPSGEYTEANIWEPAGMPLTTFDTNAVVATGNYATGVYQGQLIAPGTIPAGALGPAGMAYSTPSELVTWALSMSNRDGSAISPESAETMMTPHVNMGYDPWEHYGYGIFVTDYVDAEDPAEMVRVYEHGGNVPSYGSQLFWVPNRGLAFSILDSSMTSLTTSAQCVLQLLGGIQPRSPLTVPPDVELWDAIAGDYAVMNQVQWDSSARVVRSGDSMAMQDMESGDQTPLVNLFGRTFFLDADMNGRPDPETAFLDFTFVDEMGSGGVRWMRNRLQVGERAGSFPGLLSLQGDSCTELAFSMDVEDSQLDVRATGLAAPLTVLTDQPIAQDDPADPSTASWKHDIAVHGRVGRMQLITFPQTGDVVDLYLLEDANQDGSFTFPEELVDEGWEGSGGARVLQLTGRHGAGSYQAWAHGVAVAGTDHTFTWQQYLVDGENLQVEAIPRVELREADQTGGDHLMNLCATGTSALEGPLSGVVEIDYHSPPRRIMLGVQWSPAQLLKLYLPLVLDLFGG